MSQLNAANLFTPPAGPTLFLPEFDPEPLALAFNAGSDARLAGRSINANPHDSVTDASVYAAWRRGYIHVNTSWGLGAKWPVRPLPAIV